MPDASDDFEDQKLAEAEVARIAGNLGPFVVAAETTRMAMVFANAKEPGYPIIFANDSFLALTGYAREEVLGQNFNFLLAHVADPEALEKVKAEFEGSSECGVEINYRRKDGTKFWAGLFVNPVRDDNGNIVQYFASFTDMTKHIEAEAQSRTLIDELNHRVKNTLSVVQSIVRQALRWEADPATVRIAIETRLGALSRSHDLLTQTNWSGADLKDVIAEALAPYGQAQSKANRIIARGEGVHLEPKAVLALSMFLNELATNAAKYGALSNTTGTILIEWTIETTTDGSGLILRWEEKDGPKVAAPTHKGFGIRMIERGASYELDGAAHLEFPQSGLKCTIKIPLPKAGGDDKITG